MLNFLLQWFDEGTLAQQIFRIVALTGLLMALLQMVLSVFGGDADTDLNADPSSGTSIFSWTTIAGFALGFGAVGSLLIGQGYSVAVAALGGCGTGFAIGAVFYFLMRFFYSLKEDNTFQIENCIGRTGTVYVRIPPKATGGQVQLHAQSRYVTLAAMADEELPSGTPIRVTAVIASDLVKVERL